MSVSLRVMDALNRIESGTHTTRAGFRSLRDTELDDLKARYDDLNDAYKAQEYGYFGNILSACFKILAAGYAPDTEAGRYLMGASSAFETASTFKIKLNEQDVSKINGLLEIGRTQMQNMEKEADELAQTLQQILRILEDAQARAEKNLSAPFTNMG